VWWWWQLAVVRPVVGQPSCMYFFHYLPFFVVSQEKRMAKPSTSTVYLCSAAFFVVCF
jgi:hypothetical protein